MYEELMSMEETRRAIEMTLYYTVMPAWKGLYKTIEYKYPDIISDNVTNPYHSGNEEPLDKAQLRKFLKENRLLYDDPEEYAHPGERYWP
jgi:hypothetical protein